MILHGHDLIFFGSMERSEDECICFCAEFSSSSVKSDC